MIGDIPLANEKYEELLRRTNDRTILKNARHRASGKNGQKEPVSFAKKLVIELETSPENSAPAHKVIRLLATQTIEEDKTVRGLDKACVPYGAGISLVPLKPRRKALSGEMSPDKLAIDIVFKTEADSLTGLDRLAKNLGRVFGVKRVVFPKADFT